MWDVFAAKLDAFGALTKNTFLGGNNDDHGYGLAVDGSGAIYVSGYSAGTWGSPVRAYTAGWDTFAAKVDLDAVPPPTPTNTTTPTVTPTPSPTVTPTPTLTPTPAPVVPSFAAPIDYSTYGNNPRSVATGDFNRDGNLDLAIGGESSGYISVRLGDGTGGFGAYSPYYVGYSIYSISVGDFNSDNKLDLVTANYSGGNVSVLLGNGSGGFGGPLYSGAPGYPQFVAVGDFNGDGKADLAIAAVGGVSLVSILFGSNTGYFSSGPTYNTGYLPTSVAVRDLNGDNKLDLAVSNAGANSVSVLLGNGTGAFSLVNNYSTGASPYSVTVEDLNGDTRPDLAVANYSSNTVSILFGNGNGTFAGQAVYAAGSLPQSVVSQDFNGDGKPDLAVAASGSNTVNVLVNNGLGVFSTIGYYSAGNWPASVVAGDFNRDSRADLATANFNVPTMSVLLNTTDLAPPTVLSSVRTDANPTHASSLIFTVTFSEPVIGVDTFDFSLTSAGLTGPAITNLSGSGRAYTVAVNPGSGNGTVRLDVVDDDSIQDAASNPLGGRGLGNGSFTGGETYTVSHAAPVAVTDLRATVSAGKVKLDWTAVTTDLAGNQLAGVTYTVYRDQAQPDSTPGTAYVSGWMANTFTDDDLSVMGNTEHSTYYSVQAVYGELPSGNSTRIGVFTFPLVPGSR